MFVFCGRSRDVLAYVKSHGLTWTSQWLHDFTMKFNGQFGDGVASETATYATPESYALFAWQLFRPDGESMLRDCIERKSSAAAIANLQHMLSGFGGTGFVAKGVVHTIMDVDVRRKYFQWRSDDYFYTGVGSNPRSLINLCCGRPLSENRYGGDDDFYLRALRQITNKVRE